MKLLTFEAGPKLQEADIDAFQLHHRVVLPPAYREFLLETNGGRPARDLFRVPGFPENPVARLHFFFGLKEHGSSYDLGWNRVVHSERLPPEVLAIGTTEGSDMLCLALNDGAKVLYWDAVGGDLHYVADGFDQFVSLLVADELSPAVER